MHGNNSPERMGWMLLCRMVKASSTEKLSTVFRTTASSNVAIAHHEKLSVSAMPTSPNWYLEINSQLTKMCMHSAAAAFTKLFIWHCRNRCSGKEHRSANEKCSGMNHTETCPATFFDNSGDCPVSSSNSAIEAGQHQRDGAAAANGFCRKVA
jgi:hypothetical protein